ncbi:SDR family NAD(P)-dependent oxidoreductase [Paenibacillus sp. HB172176]|uniref:SDR family NAD(P)-dependent oxidoreductase n=1 Tax=Paenibacillus sp. HB172176 TaxID=2493690 RepID=UPI00143A4E07|nr:SDR family NAD(P)-dependent oxidoreductase [Paenibacillus sp. HB172176]
MNKNQRKPVALITGASSGIGLALTRKLLSENWEIIAMNRSDFPKDDSSLQEAVKSGRLRVYKTTDLADFKSLKATLEAVKDKEDRIDILFNNAGGSFPALVYSSQGREKHYELMTVVPYIILMELKGLVQNGKLRTVINTSSSALKFTKSLTIDILEHPPTFRKLLGPYAASKLALSLWTEAIASELAEDDIKIYSIDPGGNNTLRKGKKSGLPPLVKMLMKLFFSPPAHGANKLYEGALGEHRHPTGAFLLKGQPANLKFKDQAHPVLERVKTIYENEYVQHHQ